MEHQGMGRLSGTDNSWITGRCFQLDGRTTCNNVKRIFMSGKLRNRMVRMKNRNRGTRQNVTVVHWNMGAKQWPKKLLEMEAVTIQYSPDVFIVSESNLLEAVPTDERKIPGYNLLLPKTVELQKISRLVILVKEDLDMKVVEELGDNTLAAIWLKIGGCGRKPMLLGAVYRKHRYLLQDDPTISASDQQQLVRWSKFVDK